MRQFVTTLVTLTILIVSTQAAETWPHPIPCRVQDSDNTDLFIMTLGDVNTPLAQGIFDPVKDEVTLKDGTVKPKYYQETLGLPYYQPIDKTHFPLPPSGWCTWYYYYYHITADEVKKNARWISDHLKDYGARVIQIDDGWQRSPADKTTRDWTWVHKDYFPEGMADVAATIKSMGLVPGIWIAPHGQDNPTFVQAHPRVFILKPDSTSASQTWEGKWLLDPTTTESETYFKDLFQTLCDWGYDYFKIDGQPIVVNEYRNKQEFMAEKPSVNGAELYRRTLGWVRQVIGADRYLLGCWGIPTEGAGIMNGSRTGGDIVLGWGGFQTALSAVMGYYYQHNIMWYVDPDVMVLRSPLTLEQARVWATLQGLTGQALMATDRMMDLGDQRVELLRRVFPAVDIRPLDLFPAGHDKRIWDLKVNHLGRRYDVVGVFNFGETENETIRLKWADLGLPSDRPIHVFDFWNQDFLGTWNAGMTLDVAPTSCRVLTLMPSDSRIQLLSTNRHITQGWVDLMAQHYDPATQTYRGQSHVIKNDPYELCFVFPKGENFQVKSVSAHRGDTSLPVSTADHQGWSRIRIESPQTTDITWEVRFEPTGMYSYPTDKPNNLRVERVGVDGVNVSWSEQYYLNNGYQVYLDHVLQGYTPKASFPLRHLDPKAEHTVSIETVWEDGSASKDRAETTFTLKDLLPQQLSLLSLKHTDQGTIDIDVTRPGPRINPRMYGIFLEEINHGVDGGLYAELIRNRAFEDSRAPEGYTLQNGRWVDPGGARAGFDRFGYTTEGIPFWSLVQEGQAQGSMHLESTGGITPPSAYCLRLDVTQASPGRIGIANEGFFGIGLRQGQTYRLSLYARGTGPLAVRLEDSRGQTCSDTVTIGDIQVAWQKFTGQLTSNRTDSHTRLVITAITPGSVWLDFVSLFPTQTWKGRPNGLRSDLAQMIADLKPGFVRFPGGCVVEGGTIETAYNWKLTVGPLEQRQERWGPWMVRRTQGMGLYEYLQFCEDLEAEPLWVGFDGQTCIFRQREEVPMADMGWVRDGFLDLLDYANGLPDSQWGQLRAAAGHPQPFGLKYMEIGNENQGPAYGERYRFVYNALKQKDPHIKTLADLSWTGRESLGDAVYDIEDRHYYSSPRWFATGFHRYDERDRHLPPLYLGEVAVTSGNSSPLRGNLLAALSEGIFLMGCERNADTVNMLSYAPLLGHVQGRTELVDAPPPWHAMIYFDGTRAFGTASYYLWKLFGNHRPSYTVHTDVTLVDRGPQAITGAVGIGTWGTSAEFKDIKVEKEGQVLYSTDFSQGADDWQVESGRWSVDNTVYRQDSRRNGLSFVGDESWSDYTLTLQARKLRGPEGFLIVFGRQGGSQYWWNLGGWGNTQHAIEFNQNLVGRGVLGHIETNHWYDVKIELKGNHIRCSLDGKLVHEVTATPDETFFASAGCDEASGELVIKAINYDKQPFQAHLKLSGLDQVQPEARQIVLSNPDVTINNSLEHPRQIVPQDSKITFSGPTFDHTFPGNSLTLLRIKTR